MKLKFVSWIILLSLFLTHLVTSGFAATSNQKSARSSKVSISDTLESAGFARINSIVITGNKKTRAKVILRELTFAIGDQISTDDLMQELEISKFNVFNTALFKKVSINIKQWDEDRVDVVIDVVERWYYIPVPIFHLIDRNFNTWWQDFDHDFSRTIYGILYSQDNVTGNNDLMRIGFYTGFSQALSLTYSFPHFNKKQTLGIESFFRMSRNREFYYKSEGNKQLFYRDDNYNLRTLKIGSVLRYRRMITDEHFMGLFYHHTTVEDTILGLNDLFFLEPSTKQNYFQLSYRFESDHRNIRAYPTRGYHWSLEFEKMGLGIFGDVNHFNVYGSYAQFFDLGRRFYFSGLIRTKLSAPQKQPFYNQEALGYDQNFVRGYENYVIDGQQYGLLRLNLKNNFLNFKLPGPAFLFRDDRFTTIPFALYLKTYLDMGYVRDQIFVEGNPLNNEFLIGGGLGLDIHAFYGTVFRLEYSINRIGPISDKKLQNGLYLHFVLDIDDDMKILKRARVLSP